MPVSRHCEESVAARHPPGSTIPDLHCNGATAPVWPARHPLPRTRATGRFMPRTPPPSPGTRCRWVAQVRRAIELEVHDSLVFIRAGAKTAESRPNYVRLAMGIRPNRRLEERLGAPREAGYLS